LARYKRLLAEDDLKQNGTEMASVVELAINGEKHATEALRETVYYLGNGISNLIVGLSPQVVVVSGQITKAWNLFAGDLSRVAQRSVLAGLPETVLMPSSLGDAPTLIGAFGLILARRFGSPN
jgi:predicted NBD/HSP70 family sugar kinase